MRLGVIRDSNLYYSSNKYVTQDTYLYFINELAELVDQLVLFTPIVFRNNISNYSEINFRKNIKLVATKPYGSVVNFYMNYFSIKRHNIKVFKETFAEVDVLMLFIPHQNTIIAYPLIRAMKVPFITYTIGSINEIVTIGEKYRGWRRPFAIALSLIENIVYRRMVSKACYNFFLGNKLQKYYNGRRRNSSLLFTSLIKQDDIFRRKNMREENRINLLFMGRVAHEKGLGILLEAVSRINSELTSLKVVLDILGDGRHKEAIVSKMRKLDLNEGQVIFHGHLDTEEQECVVCRSDIFVLPSLSEGIPKVLVEAMSFGLPIVATNVGGIPDIIEDGVNGLIVPPGDPESLCAKIIMLINDEELAVRISDNGMNFAKQHTAKRQAERIINKGFEVIPKC